MAYKQHQNYRKDDWLVLDQLDLTENSRRRLIYSLKHPEGVGQLYVDLGSYTNEAGKHERVTGLCLQLPQFIDFVAGLDEVLNRVKEIVKKKPYSQVYGLEEGQATDSSLASSEPTRMRSCQPCVYMSISIKCHVLEKFKEATPGAIVCNRFEPRTKPRATVQTSPEFKRWSTLPNKPLINWTFFLDWQKQRLRVSAGDGGGAIEICQAGDGAARTKRGGQGAPRKTAPPAKFTGETDKAAAEAETCSEGEDWEVFGSDSAEVAGRRVCQYSHRRVILPLLYLIILFRSADMPDAAAALEPSAPAPAMKTSKLPEGALNLASSSANDIVRIVVRGTLERILPLTILADETDTLIREAMLGGVGALVENHVAPLFSVRAAFPVRELACAVIRAVKDLAAFRPCFADSPALSMSSITLANEFTTADSLQDILLPGI